MKSFVRQDKHHLQFRSNICLCCLPSPIFKWHETNKILICQAKRIESPLNIAYSETLKIGLNWTLVTHSPLTWPEADPDPAEDDGDKGGGDGEEVHERVQLEHEHQLVVGSDESHEEVRHEQHVQEHVKLKQLHVTVWQKTAKNWETVWRFFASESTPRCLYLKAVLLWF